MGTGNTQLVCTREEFEAVHPRGHGEHPKNKRRKNGSNGSSPWARGTLTNSLNPRTASRFIPVGTGNTYSGATFDATSTVHPRGHGEHARLLHHGISCGGSSPWARGTLSIESY